MQPYYQDPDASIDVYHGNFQEIMARLPEACFDAIITDPPYPRQYQELYADLAVAAARTLKPGGSLLAIMPHYNVPYVLRVVGEHLKWRWLINMGQEEGAHARMAMGVEVCWKPIGWWVKGSWPSGRGFRRDAFVNHEPVKTHHEWEQSPSWAREMLRFVPPGGLICDPMVGAGTTALAAKEMGYDCIAIDSDQLCCEKTKTRLTLQSRQLVTS